MESGQLRGEPGVFGKVGCWTGENRSFQEVSGGGLLGSRAQVFSGNLLVTNRSSTWSLILQMSKIEVPVSKAAGPELLSCTQQSWTLGSQLLIPATCPRPGALDWLGVMSPKTLPNGCRLLQLLRNMRRAVSWMPVCRPLLPFCSSSKCLWNPAQQAMLLSQTTDVQTEAQRGALSCSRFIGRTQKAYLVSFQHLPAGADTPGYLPCLYPFYRHISSP